MCPSACFHGGEAAPARGALYAVALSALGADAAPTKGVSLLQTQLGLRRSGTPPASLGALGAGVSSELGEHGPIPAEIIALCFMLVPILLHFAIRGISRMATYQERHTPLPPIKGVRDGTRKTIMPLSALDTLAATLALATESAIGAVGLPLLPAVGGGLGEGSVLLVARPLVGVAVTVLLPLLLFRGQRSSRLGTAAGLMLLSLCCFGLAVNEAGSFGTAMAAGAMGAFGSSLVLASTVQTTLLQVPTWRIGWRLDGALYGIALGTCSGPALGEVLASICGESVPMMMVCLAMAAASTCCLHLAVSGYVVESGAGYLGGDDGSGLPEVVAAAQRLRKDRRLCWLLAVCGASSSLLALHGTLMPSFLRADIDGNVDLASEGRANFLGEGASGGFAMGVSLLACGLAGDLMRERLSMASLVVAAAAGALGLRAVVAGRFMAQPAIVSLGLLASQSGIGAMLGYATPLLARLALELPVGARDESALPSPAVAAVVSAALNAAWHAGGAGSIALQMVLFPLVGHAGAISVFAGGLVLLAAAALTLPLHAPKLATRVKSLGPTW